MLPRDKADTLYKIIPSAKKEFMEKGFEKASVRKIAENAGITAAGLYRHFKDKEAMFTSLVESAANELIQMYVMLQQEFEKKPEDVQRKEVFDYSTNNIGRFMDCIYDHFDEFKLLITCSEGTEFSGYIDKLVDIEVESTLDFIEITKNRALSSGKVSFEMIHIISNAFLSAVFESVRHDMPKEKANGYVFNLSEFFTAGWKRLLGS